MPRHDRSDCRLMVLDRATGAITDTRFAQITDWLRPGDCLVLNDTKVIQARFLARRRTGGRIEGLFLCQRPDGTWQVMLRPSARLKDDEQIDLLDGQGNSRIQAVILSRQADGTILIRPQQSCNAHDVLDQIGLPPLPPYIKRAGDPKAIQIDRRYYQTVYATNPGAVAAPTAGLHFTDELLGQIKASGVAIAHVTLHVGPGSFRPVKCLRMEDHKVFPERMIIGQQAVQTINQAKASGGRIVAVGTTSVRAIETAAIATPGGWALRPFDGQTDLYILPGYEFKITDCIITNFHLPRSTLLALVAAFAGLGMIKSAYQHAIDRQYMFYSYGDAMLIL